MAGNYGVSFGFRSSNETRRWSEGRYKLPAAGTFLLGSLVEINFAAPGELKQSATNTGIVPKVRGLLLQEGQWDHSVFGTDPAGIDSFALGVGKNGKQAVITGGAGVKIWLKNVSAATRSDGRSIAARTMYSTAGSLAEGDTVSWDGSKFVKTGQSATTVAVGTVTKLTSTYVEIVLNA